MKKVFLLVLASLMLLVPAFGCASAKEPENRLEKILSTKVLTFGTSPDFAPMEFIDDTKEGVDQYVGAEVEMAKYIAKELGVELKIEPMDFTALQTAITTGQIDLALSGFAWTEERAENVGLTDFYNSEAEKNGQGLLVLKTELDSYKAAQDFAGKKVACQNASLQMKLATAQLPEDVELVPIGALPDAVMMLVTGKVDAVACAGTNAKILLQNNPEIDLCDFYFEYSSDGNVGMVNKEETELLVKINEIIAKMNDEGIFYQWSADATALAMELGIE